MPCITNIKEVAGWEHCDRRWQRGHIWKVPGGVRGQPGRRLRRTPGALAKSKITALVLSHAVAY